MIEQVYHFSTGDKKAIERVLFDENLHFIHFVLNLGESLPEHYTNGNVYMTVLRGRLSLSLGEQEIHEYPAGTMLKFPPQTKMLVENRHEGTLELIVVKAPAPKA